MVFFNEKDEPYNTIKSIYATAPHDLFKIIAVDDCSTEEIKDITGFENVRYIRNSKRLGSHVSRHLGIMMADTPYVLSIDAHMRFYKDNWCSKIIAALKKEPESVFGVVCGILLKDDQNKLYSPPSGKDKGYGANMELKSADKVVSVPAKEIFAPKWYSSPRSDNLLPCLLGACYGISKKFYEKIKGFEGLKIWGSTEAYLSLKVWMAGGSCKLLRSVEVGHIFKKKKHFTLPPHFSLYNKLFILKTLCPPPLEAKIKSWIPYSKHLEFAEMLMEQNEDYINSFKQYYSEVFPYTIYDYFEKFNIRILED